MSKRAFLVGINDFETVTPLRGCVNDTEDMQDLLTSKYGFAADDFRILHNAEARGDAIKEGLRWLSEGSKAGDVRVFHFASHGTHVADQGDDGDYEWEGEDEVIVPYDHSWETPFRDDDLRAEFDRFGDGVNFTFIADCCHSGTMQRGLTEDGIEFMPRLIAPPREIQDEIDAIRAKRNQDLSAYIVKNLTANRDADPADLEAMVRAEVEKLTRAYKNNKYGAVQAERHVLLAGCQDNQTSADAHIAGTWRGAFTWGLCRTLRESGDAVTHAEAIAHTGNLLTSYTQVPQLECPDALRNVPIFTPLGGGA